LSELNFQSEAALYDGCNRTELYQLALDAGLSVPSTATREEILAIYLGFKEPETNAMNKMRDDLMTFVIDHKGVLSSQLKCPAKSMDPRACYQCIDTQVVTCFVQSNGVVDRYLQIRRK
jgi:hypothetical protein